MWFSKLFKKATERKTKEEEHLEKFIKLNNAFIKKSEDVDDFLRWKKNSESFQEDYEKIKNLLTARFDKIPIGTKFWSGGWAYGFDYGIKVAEEGKNVRILYSKYSYKEKEALGWEKVLIDPTEDTF